MASTMYDNAYKDIKNASGQGQNAINSFDPSGFGNKSNQGFNSLWGNQQGQTDNYIQQYKDTITGQSSLPETYDRLNQQFNVPALAQNANYLQNQVLSSPSRNLNMARGFNYDQNQVDKATNLELARLSPLAQNAQNQLQTAQGFVDRGVGYQQTQNQYELQPLQQQGQMMNDLFARQASGYTTTVQAELEGLISKMNAGVTLSTAEMQRLAELSQAEMDYQATLNTNQTTLGKTALENQYKIVPAGETLYNTGTGGTYRAK